MTEVPADEQKLYETVERSIAAENLKQAVISCRELNVRFPEYFDGWRIAGDVHQLLGKPEAMLFSTEKAEALRSGDPCIALQRIEACIALNDITTARRLLLEFDESVSATANVHDRLGRHMASLDLHERASVQYAKALALDPVNPALMFNLATAQRFLGETDAAIATLDHALSIDNTDVEAQAMRSSLSKQTRDTNHIDELKFLMQSPDLPAVGKTSLCYALAKELDDLDDTEQSFMYLQRGSKLRRAQMDYKVDTDIEIISEIQRVYSADFFATDEQGDPNGEAIFIVGMPRTGTTLVERILSSHTAVYAAGELDNFGREMIGLAKSSGMVAGADRHTVIESCSKLNFSTLGKSYIESTRPMTSEHPRFVDKLPFNYLYVGLIHRALPNARIINLVRHPMATCYAVFKQLFRDPYPFSYDLEELARYFLAYSDLMEHWSKMMPGKIHTVSYEDIVDDTEAEARRLLDYCGLDWEDRCLRFYENRQASTTASASQVRQPVYRSSLNRWQQYRNQLQPVEQLLNEAGVETAVKEIPA